MATLQTLHSGPRNHIVKVDFEGDESDETIVDLSALSGADEVKLVKAEWSIEGAAGTDGMLLEWDATADTPLLFMNVGEGRICFPGGVRSDAGAGATGDVTATATGAAALGTAVLEFKKVFKKALHG